MVLKMSQTVIYRVWGCVPRLRKLRKHPGHDTYTKCRRITNFILNSNTIYKVITPLYYYDGTTIIYIPIYGFL